MDNEDVVNYVELYREKASKAHQRVKDNINVNNACIAQLLCEEARIRWLSIVEEDNTPIDDISCMIFELNRGYDIKVHQQRRQNVLNIDTNKVLNELQIKDAQANDNSRRGSQVLYTSQ